MQWTQDQQDEALRLLAEVGKAEASRRTGIPAGTIAAWGSRSGTKAPPAAALQEVNAARLATIAQRKAKLAEELLGDIERMRKQLWQPTVECKAMTVSDGSALGSHIEIAEVRLPQPTFRDQKTIVEAVAIALDKVQLLTGEATVRTEALGAEQPKREHLAKVVDQLAERRVA